jgi:hypothetical protein
MSYPPAPREGQLPPSKNPLPVIAIVAVLFWKTLEFVPDLWPSVDLSGPALVLGVLAAIGTAILVGVEFLGRLLGRAYRAFTWWWNGPVRIRPRGPPRVSLPAPEPILPAPRSAAQCPFCGEGVSREDEVRCQSCHTPHHRDCWATGEICTTYGCGSREAAPAG